MSRILISLIALLSLVTACGPASVSDRNAVAQDTWAAAGIQNYTFHYDLQCFCFGPTALPATVTVRNGAIADVDFGGRMATDDEKRRFSTIDTLLRQIANEARSDVDAIHAEYDEALGYPTRFFVDPRRDIMDEEWGFAVNNFSLLPD